MKRSKFLILVVGCVLLLPAVACVVESLRFDRLACTSSGECSSTYKCFRVPSVGNLCLSDGGGFEPFRAQEAAPEGVPESPTEAAPESPPEEEQTSEEGSPEKTPENGSQTEENVAESSSEG